MAVKIWDEQSNAFKDAEIPMVWDEASGAYKDSTGLVYNESAGAWSERWNSFDGMYLYNKGYENNITGGWGTTTYGTGSVARKDSDRIYLHSYRGSIYTNKKVDLIGYNKLVVICPEIKGRTDNSRHATLGIWINGSLNIRYGTAMDFASVTKKTEDIDVAEKSLYNKLVNDYSLEMDISNVNSEQYICVRFDGEDNHVAYGYISQIYLI